MRESVQIILLLLFKLRSIDTPREFVCIPKRRNEGFNVVLMVRLKLRNIQEPRLIVFLLDYLYGSLCDEIDTIFVLESDVLPVRIPVIAFVRVGNEFQNICPFPNVIETAA